LTRSTTWCRHLDKQPEWTLAHLTRLTELNLKGDDVMLELLRSPATLVLPPSLQALRQESWEPLHSSAAGR